MTVGTSSVQRPENITTSFSSRDTSFTSSSVNTLVFFSSILKDIFPNILSKLTSTSVHFYMKTSQKQIISNANTEIKTWTDNIYTGKSSTHLIIPLSEVELQHAIRLNDNKVDEKRRHSGLVASIVPLLIAALEYFCHHPGEKRLPSKNLNYRHTLVVSHNLRC